MLGAQCLNPIRHPGRSRRKKRSTRKKRHLSDSQTRSNAFSQGATCSDCSTPCYPPASQWLDLRYGFHPQADSPAWHQEDFLPWRRDFCYLGLAALDRAFVGLLPPLYGGGCERRLREALDSDVSTPCAALEYLNLFRCKLGQVMGSPPASSEPRRIRSQYAMVFNDY